MWTAIKAGVESCYGTGKGGAKRESIIRVIFDYIHSSSLGNEKRLLARQEGVSIMWGDGLSGGKKKGGRFDGGGIGLQRKVKRKYVAEKLLRTVFKPICTLGIEVRVKGKTVRGCKFSISWRLSDRNQVKEKEGRKMEKIVRM